MTWYDECVCNKYADERKQAPACMAFWCPVHDNIQGSFAKLEKSIGNLTMTRYKEALFGKAHSKGEPNDC